MAFNITEACLISFPCWKKCCRKHDLYYLQVNLTSNCNYDYELVYFDHLIDFSREKLCPDVAKSEVIFKIITLLCSSNYKQNILFIRNIVIF